MERFYTLCLTLVMIISTLIPSKVTAQPGSTDPELYSKTKQFDFWIGQWDVFKYGTDTILGYSHIESINDSLALLENWSSAKSAFLGKSLNNYNRATDKWEQYWSDNTGLVLKLAGEFDGKSMILTDTSSNTYNRITWTPTINDEVRQTWDISTNKGTTWKTVFDGSYRKRTNGHRQR